MNSLRIKRLRTKAIFKILFAGLFCSFIPFFSVMGLLASQGLITMYFGETQLFGMQAMLAGPLFGLLFTLLFGLFVGIFTTLGLMIYAKRKNISIEYYPVESTDNRS